jgi:hypothetical protein
MSYIASPTQILAWSNVLEYFNLSTVDTIVDNGMSELYYRVMPMPMTNHCDEEVAPFDAYHQPMQTTLHRQSYVYTSHFKHNRLDIQLFQQNQYRLFVQFRITPTHEPDKNTQKECNKIEKEIADVIYEQVLEHGEERRRATCIELYER